MSDKKTETVLLTGTADKLTPKALAELKSKYGIDIKLRSSSAAIGKLIAAVDLTASYDRTHPGYDRSYDRDPDVRHQIGAVINPVDVVTPSPKVPGGGTSKPGR